MSYNFSYNPGRVTFNIFTTLSHSVIQLIINQLQKKHCHSKPPKTTHIAQTMYTNLYTSKK